jgi:multidrug efflux pump subunit AcrB
MNLTELSIKNRITTYLLILLLLLFGVLSYKSLEKAEDPGFTIKVALITTNWPGATAEQVANLVSKKIENEVKSIDALNYVTSKNTDGQSNVYVNIRSQYKELGPIWQELRDKINTYVVPQLPQGAQTPMINTYFGDVYGSLITLSSEDYSYAELYKEAEKLKEYLFFSAPEIGKIDISGVQSEVIYINIDNARLANSGISLQSIAQALSSSNVIVAGGTLLNQNDRIMVIPEGNYNDLTQIEKTIISSSDGKNSLFLKDIATIERGYQDPASFKIFYSGKKSLVIAVSLRKGENIIAMGDKIKDAVNKFEKSLPIGMETDIVYFQPSLVEEKVTSFISNLFQAIVTILIIMFMFLGFRTGVIVASLTPTSIAFTMIGLMIFGYGINQITLAGLIIALGMLVDNAVVMCESIIVMIQNGKGKLEACLDSAKSLALPLFTSSLTTIAAFAPIALNKEDMGEYVGPMAVVVLLALMGSWLINQTFVPLLCNDFLKVDTKQHLNLDNKWYSLYRTTLIKLLKNKKMTVLGAFLSFVLGIFLFKFIPQNFMPESTTPIVLSVLQMPRGTALEETEKVANDLTKYIEKNFYIGKTEPLSPTILDYILTGGTEKKYPKEGILSMATFVGGGAPKFTIGYTPEAQMSEYALILMNVTNYKLVKKYSSEINLYMQENYPEVDIVSKGLSNGSTYVKELGYQFSSHNQELLNRVVEEVKEKMREIEGIRNISDNWGNQVARLKININQDKAKKAGLSNQQIGELMQYNLQGTTATIFRDFNAPPKATRIPITIKGTNNYSNNITGLESLELINPNNGQSVPLDQIASIDLGFGPSFVFTRNMTPTVEVNADTAQGYTSADLNKQIYPWIKERMKEWGSEVKFYLAGQQESSEKNQGGLVVQLPIAFLVMALLVIAQFNSIKKGICILMTIPLSILGCALGLLITGIDFGFMAMIGIISLAGVVINHGIILIDTFTNEKESGKSDQDAIVFGAQSRVRPIILTVVTTLCGLLPLYFFGGPLFQPLAAVQIFGLAMDTLLSLIAVPAIYAYMMKVDFDQYEYKIENRE